MSGKKTIFDMGTGGTAGQLGQGWVTQMSPGVAGPVHQPPAQEKFADFSEMLKEVYSRGNLQREMEMQTPYWRELRQRGEMQEKREEREVEQAVERCMLPQGISVLRQQWEPSEVGRRRLVVMLGKRQMVSALPEGGPPLEERVMMGQVVVEKGWGAEEVGWAVLEGAARLLLFRWQG